MGKAINTCCDNMGYFNPPNVYRPAIIDIRIVGEYSAEDGATNTYRITQNDGKIFEFDVKNGSGGSAGRSVTSVEQIQVSTESLGKNVARINLSDGTYTDVEIRNGAQGEVGPRGERGPAGVDQVEATVDNAVGTPSVDTSVVDGKLHLDFHNMKGVQGEPAVGIENYVTVEATAQTTAATDVLPATGSADTLYRVACWDGAQYDTTVYSVYGWYDGAYKFLEKKQPGIDDEPTLNSQNLVKSGGVAAKLSQLGQNAQNTVFNLGEIATKITMSPGYVRCNGAVGTVVDLTPVSHSTYKYAIVDCVDGDVFYIQGNGGNSDRIYCFVDAENRVVKSGASGVTFNTNIIVIAPENSRKIIINDETGVGVSYYQESFTKKCDRSFYDIAKVVFNKVLEYAIVESGKYYDYAKQLQSNSAFSIASVPVENVNRIIAKCRSGYLAYSYWVDADNVLHYAFAGNEHDGINILTSLSVPTYAKQLLISFVTGSGLEIIACGETNIADKLIEIEKDFNEKTSGNLVFDSSVSGYYLNVNGVETPLSTGVIDKYAIQYCSKIHIKARIGGLMYIIFYDENNNILTKYVGNDGTGINVDNDYNVPDNCAYVRVSYVNDYPGIVTMVYPSLQAQIDEIKEATPWIGKKIGLLGDSIAAGSVASSVDKRFIAVAASILGATYKNAAIGGWYLGDQLEDGAQKSIWRQIDGVSPATTHLDGDEDVIVIWAGTNDFGHDFTPGEPYTILETAQDGFKPGHKLPTTDTTTSCGGLVKTIQTLYTKYGGYIPILICLPLQRKSAGGDGINHGSYGGSWDMTIENHRYMENYIDAIKKTANYYGIPVADFYHNNMNPNIAAANTKYFGTTSNPGGDGLHPNDLGHRLIGERLAEILKKEILFED